MNAPTERETEREEPVVPVCFVSKQRTVSLSAVSLFSYRVETEIKAFSFILKEETMTCWGQFQIKAQWSLNHNTVAFKCLDLMFSIILDTQ